jgi:hypothetical protein
MTPNLPVPSPSISNGLKGLAIAALTAPLVLVIRLPIDGYFSGLGLLQWLEPLPIRILFSAMAAFVALAVPGLPIWLLYRRWSRQPRFWHFAVVGIAAGILLASRVNVSAYRSPDFHYPWVQGQQTLRPAMDAASVFLNAFLPFIAFWFAVYRRRSGMRSGSV